jgi:hypothetical protein
MKVLRKQLITVETWHHKCIIILMIKINGQKEKKLGMISKKNWSLRIIT